jgi:hypothetical protein
VVWEGFFSGFVRGARLLSISHAAIAMMHGMDPRRFAFDIHPAFLSVSTVAFLAFAAFAYASVRRLKTMDVP